MERLQHFGGERVVAAERFNFDAYMRACSGARAAEGQILLSWHSPQLRIPPLSQHRCQTLPGLHCVGRGGITLQVILPESDRLGALGAEKFSKFGIRRGDKNIYARLERRNLG